MRPSEAIPAGAVLGHEFSGRIAEVGAGVEGWSPGELVAVLPFVPCGECALCASGREHLCPQNMLTGFGLGQAPGAYAESIVVPGSILFRVPEGVSEQHAALTEPLAVAVHGLNVGEADPAEPAVVLGAGPIGVLTAHALRARGAESILVVEPNERRRARMEQHGFAVAPLDGVHEQVIEWLGGLLPPLILECAGHPAALNLALELVRPGGRIVALGVLEEPVEINQLVLIIKEAQIRGSFAYDRASFSESLEMLAAGRVPADDLITAVVDLERANEMFDELTAPGTEHVKVLLRP
jgi:2-desacetyl-2-hydroxyethyl bacteriochlorophyllide A dehydrogenase